MWRDMMRSDGWVIDRLIDPMIEVAYYNGLCTKGQTMVASSWPKISNSQIEIVRPLQGEWHSRYTVS